MMVVIMPIAVRMTMGMAVIMPVTVVMLMVMVMMVVTVVVVIMIVVVVVMLVRVTMIMAVTLGVSVVVAMIMVVMLRRRVMLETFVGAFIIFTIFAVLGVHPFDMMVVALLLQADFGLEPQNLRPIFAQLTIHIVGAIEDFLNAVLEGFNDIVLIVEISRLDELDVRMARCDLIGEIVDATDENAGEEEIGENDNALVAKLGGMFEARFDQRERDARIANLAPAKAHAFPKHAHQLVDVGIGIRIGSAATDHHQQGIGDGNFAMLDIGCVHGLLNTSTGCLDHLEIKTQLAAIFNRYARRFGLIGIEHRGDVILGMTGSKQHAGNGQNARASLRHQIVQSLGKNRIGEFQIAIVNWPFGETGSQTLRQLGELIDSLLIAATVAADHQAEFFLFVGTCHSGPLWSFMASLVGSSVDIPQGGNGRWTGMIRISPFQTCRSVLASGLDLPH